MKTIREAILQSLDDIQRLTNYSEVYDHIVKMGYYVFTESKTPKATISAQLGRFIRKGDTRVKRIKQQGGTFSYYLAKYESQVLIEDNFDEQASTKEATKKKNGYEERDLHILLSSYLKNTNVFSKTIFHEKSLNSKDSHQKWVHPDMVGVKFLKLQTKESQTFLNAINKVDAFKISSYELKKEINTDYELKKCFFQAVSNSSWANYGYLVAFEISNSLHEEMERLHESFGIGIIQLKPNPYESKVLYSAKYKELDFKTIDKLCKINRDFAQYIEQTEKLISAEEKYTTAAEKELEDFCDTYFRSDSEMEEYTKRNNIKIEE